MVKCSNCSNDNPQNNRFCGVCGAVLAQASQSSLAETVAMAVQPAPTPRTSSPRTPPSSDSADEGRFLPGTLLAERYRIIGLLGRGGMGEVYRATDLVLGQQVALKFLPQETASDPDVLARFHSEVRIARQVSHPNVCRVYDIGSLDGQPYISMEYVDGENLAGLLRRIGRLPNDTAVEMARKLCAGLAAAHDKGVLHRDLKPANVMIDSRGQVLVTDFGLAGLATQIQGAEIRHGTPAYMAPEQLAGKEVSVRSDIYSLGLVLYEMFTGKRAYEAATMAEMVRLREESAPVSLGSLVRDLDPAVERVVLRCLEREPQSRPSSALAVAAALPGGDPLAAALAAGETPSPELVAAASEHEALNPRVALACLVAILALLAGVPYLVSGSSWITKTPFESPPDALAQKARELTQSFGYTAKPVDTAYGLEYDSDYLTDLRKRGTAMSTLQHLSTGQPAPILFWYRTSPRYMIADRVASDGEVSPADPPTRLSGMVTIALDPQAHLVSFEAVPPQVETSPGTPKPLDKNALLVAAGLDPSRFEAAEPQWTPTAICDQRAAWIGTYPQDSNPLRVEAASWRGKLVYFDLISPWTRPARMQPAQPTRAEKIGQVIGLCFLSGIAIGAVILARHNIRMGRGDWRNAFRLCGFISFLTVGAWALTAHHAPAIPELIIIFLALASCLLAAALIWVLYVALEPFVRRHWPRTLISWTRILSGRLRDPVVGGHVLVGLLYGVSYCLLAELYDFLNVRANGVPDQLIQFDTFLNASHVAGSLLWVPLSSITNTLGIFFVVFVLRVIFRREWLAAAAFVIILTLLTAFLSQASLLVSLPIRLAQNVMLIFILLRFGFLSFVVGAGITSILSLFPVTTDFSAWYAGSTIFAIAFVVALAIWAFHTALAGRPVFKSQFLE